MNNRIVSVSLSEDILKELKKLALKEKRPLSQLVRNILIFYLEEYNSD
jgi:metal-responsive CopG/Arc/MetJ family transcriptional regulator